VLGSAAGGGIATEGRPPRTRNLASASAHPEHNGMSGKRVVARESPSIVRVALVWARGGWKRRAISRLQILSIRRQDYVYDEYEYFYNGKEDGEARV
jgi:hypothetical protein